jgi:hypothetical protein
MLASQLPDGIEDALMVLQATRQLVQFLTEKRRAREAASRATDQGNRGSLTLHPVWEMARMRDGLRRCNYRSL